MTLFAKMQCHPEKLDLQVATLIFARKTFAYDNAFARDKLLENFSKHFFDIDIPQENSLTLYFFP